MRLSEYIPKTSQEGIDGKISQLADDIWNIYRDEHVPLAQAIEKAKDRSTLGPKSIQQAVDMVRRKLAKAMGARVNEAWEGYSLGTLKKMLANYEHDRQQLDGTVLAPKYWDKSSYRGSKENSLDQTIASLKTAIKTQEKTSIDEGADAAVYGMAELLVSQVHAGRSLQSAVEKLQKRSKISSEMIQKAVQQAKEMLRLGEDAPVNTEDSAEIDKMVQRIIYHVKKGRPFGMAVNRAFEMSKLPASAIHAAMDKAHTALKEGFTHSKIDSSVLADNIVYRVTKFGMSWSEAVSSCKRVYADLEFSSQVWKKAIEKAHAQLLKIDNSTKRK